MRDTSLHQEVKMSRNKKWSATVKFEIALLAHKGEMTINEICTKYEVSPSQVHAWKKQLIEDGANLFGKAADKAAKESAAEQEGLQQQLYEKIGQLTVERDFLKKVLGKFHGSKGES